MGWFERTAARNEHVDKEKGRGPLIWCDGFGAEGGGFKGLSIQITHNGAPNQPNSSVKLTKKGHHIQQIDD